jgi:hypothetical protein
MLVTRMLARCNPIQGARMVRWASTSDIKDKYKIIVVGGGMFSLFQLIIQPWADSWNVVSDGWTQVLGDCPLHIRYLTASKRLASL